MLTRCSLRNEQSIRQQSLNTCSFQAGNKATRPNCSLCPSARTDHQLLRLASTARKMNEKPSTFSQIVSLEQVTRCKVTFEQETFTLIQPTIINKARVFFFVSQNYSQRRQHSSRYSSHFNTIVRSLRKLTQPIELLSIHHITSHSSRI